MKRLLIVFLILATGTSFFWALRSATADIQRELDVLTVAWQNQTQQFASMLLESQSITAHWHETRQALESLPQPARITQLAERILKGATAEQLSPAESEELLAALGFNWNTTGDYLIVSKKSLTGISFDALKGTRISEVAQAVFAITPDEQSALQSPLQQISDARSTWVREHIQREEPNGDILAKYSLPVDAEFSLNQLALFTNSVFNTLGVARAEMFQDHSRQWLTDSGMRLTPDYSNVLRAAIPALDEPQEPQPTTLTVERYQSGDEWHINYHLEQEGNSMTTSVNPWQPFPAAFKPLFPNGWPDLAQAEGFDLPNEFQNHQPR